MAHVNTSGNHVPLFVVSQNSSIGWELNADYPNQEGSFFGNVFTLGAHGGDSNTVQAFYCNGKAYDIATVPGRIGTYQTNAPYKNPYIAGPYGTTTGGYCSDTCTASDGNPDAGFKACSGWNNVVTTYRKAAAVSGSNTVVKTTPTLTAGIIRYFQSSFGYCANVFVTNKTSTAIPSWTVAYDTGTATQYFRWFGTETAVGSVHTVKATSAFLALPPNGTRWVGYCARYNGAAVTPIVRSVSAP
jgi:hypothetical protein